MSGCVDVAKNKNKNRKTRTNQIYFDFSIKSMFTFTFCPNYVNDLNSTEPSLDTETL